MRRLAFLLVFVAALATAMPAAADLRPIRRDFGEFKVPRVRAGTIALPPAHARGRITVIVRLAQPPLAQYGRGLMAASGARKLDVQARSSQAYLARLAAAQRVAEAQLGRAIPEAQVRRRYRIVLNGLAVDLPARALPTLLRQPFVTRVYPSLRFTLTLDDSPGVIHATALAASTGARGDGTKIAVVDDGVDQANAFFDPSGFSYPSGFPRGDSRWTTPKVIVARAFPGPGSGDEGRLALDPQASFHGTHVAGIAAGNAGTQAPAGSDHPLTTGLSGVAPRAWIGNYRVFTVPTPIGHVANTPEIIAAFESAVSDGMDVINFSGGGPQSEPQTDALSEAVRNVAAAGVVPVISAGNDRDEFGFGSAGAPGTAPDAISVAAASNLHIFAPALDVVATSAPSSLRGIPFAAAGSPQIPGSWGSTPQALVDVGSVIGTDGQPVDRRLCSRGADPNTGAGTLPQGSLQGAIALASRGVCTFVSKAERAKAAGAIGLVIADNRAGEPNPIPVGLVIPGGMISDLDAARLRTQMQASGGRTLVQIGRDTLQLETGRSGVITSFSSAGPTAFGHDLKPDIAAPGGQILSATLPNAGGPFAVFDGTSMAAPHVAGAAALLRQRHPGWTAQQVKSALMSTAGAVWTDTARTVEAPVILGGAGLVDLTVADDPKLFTQPASLSFDDLDVTAGARSSALLVRLSDAGGGAGSWQVELKPQAATPGASLVLPGTLEVAPGGAVELSAGAQAQAGATAGENYGFILLRRGDVTRRIPYFFLVLRPSLASLPEVPLQLVQEGDTRSGPSVVSSYRYPTAPFGQPPDYGFAPPMDQSGAEKVFSFQLSRPVANFGVAVAAASENSLVDPWVLGSKDESDVQGYAGTPVNVNPLTFGFRVDIGVAGAVLPRAKTYYVSVDSGRNPFTGAPLPGQYVLQSWVDDVYPPAVHLLTTRVSAGRPTLALRATDPRPGSASGIDALSIAVGYQRVLVGAAVYDPTTGIALIPLPQEAPALNAGRRAAALVASDNQEAKNVNSTSELVMPNTAAREQTLTVVNGPTGTWLTPRPRACAERRAPLLVVAGSTAQVRSVRFFDGPRRIATVTRGPLGFYVATWATQKAKRGAHTLRAVVLDARGRRYEAKRSVRVCR